MVELRSCTVRLTSVAETFGNESELSCGGRLDGLRVDELLELVVRRSHFFAVFLLESVKVVLLRKTDARALFK